MPPRPSSRSSSNLVALALVVSMPVSLALVLAVVLSVPLVSVTVARDRGRRRGGRGWAAGRGVGGDGCHAVEEWGAQPCRHAARCDERACFRGERGDLASGRAAVARRVARHLAREQDELSRVAAGE